MALFTGSNLIDLDEIDSTNNYALNLLKEKQPFEGTVVRTFRQTVGRGQRLKHWESEDFSNLTFSIIYYPAFLSVSDQFQLSKTVTLGVADFIHSVLKDENVKIKWPNDIYIGYKKAAGILIENTVSLGRLSSSVIGIGININQEKFSEEIPNPVSLKMLKGEELDLNKCFDELCSTIEARYMQLKLGRQNEIDQHYHQSLYLLNRPATFLIKGKEQQAEIIGVDDIGRLKLKTASGIIECGLHEVTYL